MNILDNIIIQKRKEVAHNKCAITIAQLEKESFFRRQAFDFPQFISDPARTGIVAEFKRRSPSKGVINESVTVLEVTSAYTTFGASALSVLTDELFFGGTLNDLRQARVNDVPLLRKDFIIDEYQLVESKANGADVILLIAACLSQKECAHLAAVAKNIGLNVLLEIHTEEELPYIGKNIDVVGINNRDLKTFTVDIKRSIELAKKIPPGILKISESGLENASTIRELKENGFAGFLMGEKFMKEKDPGLAFKNFADGMRK